MRCSPPIKKYGAELCFLLLIPLVFCRAFFAQYVTWDDDVLILRNPLLQAPFWEALKSSFQVYYHGDYFPLTLMSYWVDYQLFGLNAQAQHLENLVLHVGAVILLYRILRSFTQNDALSFLISLIFAVHPLQMESVMWLSERKSLLAAVFMFLSLGAYLKNLRQPMKTFWYWLSMLFFVLMALTKATGILLPLLFLLLDWHFLKNDYRRLCKRFLPLGMLAGTLIFLRIQAYSSSATEASEILFNSERLLLVPLMALTAIGFYLKMFFFPTTYSPVYEGFQISEVPVMGLVLTLSFLILMGIYIWRRQSLFLIFCAAWFLLFLTPVLQIFPRINFVNDRYMYLPIVGLAGICLFWIQEKVPLSLRTHNFFAIASFVVAASLGLQSFARSQAFVSNRELWTQALKVVPQDMIALNNLGLDYQLAGEVDKAVDFLERVIQQPGKSSLKANAFGNLASIYSNRRYAGYNPEKALALVQEGLNQVHRIRDTYELRINGALIYKDIGKHEEAKVILTAVLEDLAKESDYKFRELKSFVAKQL